MNTETMMKDSKGRYVPAELVDPIDRQRDELVKELTKEAEELNVKLRKFKEKTFADVAAFVDLSAEKYQKKYGGEKGNLSLLSYDGSLKVQISIADNIDFNERLQIAKELIDECLDDWGSESRSEMRAIVDKAFYVDKGQRLNVKAILGLRTLNINHPKWRKAMEAINDAIIIRSTKSYIRFYSVPRQEKFPNLS